MGLFDGWGNMGGTEDAVAQPPGLLDNIGTWLKDPRNAAGLQAFGAALAKAGAPTREPKGSFAGGLSEALSGFTQGQQGFDEQKLKKMMQKLQMQHLEAQNSELAARHLKEQQAAARAQQIQGLMSGNPALTLGAQSGDVGPTVTNAERIPANPLDAYGTRASILENAGFINEGFKLRKDAKDLMPKVDKYETLMGKNGPQLMALFQDASAPKAISGLSQLDDPNKAFGRTGVPNVPFQNYELNKARAGKTSVSVNTGQKGLDNELKIRSDFRAEPIYKAHSEVQSAYEQIKQGLSLASPAGDLAAGTKIMKLLDPTSVVRESELAMAMAAGGKFDKLAWYAQNALSGNKLTPTQRIDFRKLADGLFKDSETLYNAKRSEYRDIAKKHELDSDLITGKDSTGMPDDIKALVKKHGG